MLASPPPTVRGTREQFRLGLVTSKSADHSGLLTYQADVYNLVERVKLVEVSEAGGWRLTWTLAGGERQEVRKEKTKTYRESDRNLPSTQEDNRQRLGRNLYLNIKKRWKVRIMNFRF